MKLRFWPYEHLKYRFWNTWKICNLVNYLKVSVPGKKSQQDGSRNKQSENGNLQGCCCFFNAEPVFLIDSYFTLVSYSAILNIVINPWTSVSDEAVKSSNAFK